MHEYSNICSLNLTRKLSNIAEKLFGHILLRISIVIRKYDIISMAALIPDFIDTSSTKYCC